MKIRALSTSLAAVLSVSLLAVQPVSAFTVIDPIQNTLTAISAMEQVNNQVQQLQNESEMLINQARNLASLDFNIVNAAAFVVGDERATNRRGAGAGL